MYSASQQTARPRPDGRVGVFVAHPGHELRIRHWMEQHATLYGCLTDGSGGSATSRIGSTRRVVESLGGVCGPLFGRFADRDVYRLLLERRVEVFVALAEELADIWTRAEITHVVGDAVEGFNPVHDVCRFIIDGAAAIVSRRTGQAVRNDDFVLDSPPDACPPALRPAATWLRLDRAALERKVAAALGYEELRAEVTAALERYGKEAFAIECLRPAATPLMLDVFERELPEYEHHGAIR